MSTPSGPQDEVLLEAGEGTQIESTSRSVLDRVTSACGILGGAGIVLMMLHVVADVVMRYTLNQPAPATLEISQFWYMPIIVFLGLAMAERTDQHISAPIVYDRLKPRLKIEFAAIGAVLSVALLVGFAWYGLEEALTLMEQGAIGIGSGVPIWQPRFLVPIGTLLFALELIAKLIRQARAYQNSTRKVAAE